MAAARTHEGFLGEAGARTWYQIHGDRSSGAVPLLMLHGGPGGPWPTHLDAVDRWAEARPVVLYHQLGCGRSDDPADPSRWSVDAFLEELAMVRRELGLDQVHLYGWSWGGLLAIAHAASGAAGVRSVVLASPVVSQPLWCEEGLRLRDELPAPVAEALRRHDDRVLGKPTKASKAGQPKAGRTEKQIRRSAGVFRRLVPVIVSGPVQKLGVAMSRVPFLLGASHQLVSMQFIRSYVMRADEMPVDLFTMFAGMNNRLFKAMWGPSEYLCTGTLLGVDYTDRLADIHVPVLVTSGRYDEATPKQMEAIVEHAPDARWVVFEDSAHCAVVEETDRYVATVEDFLRSVDSP